MKEQLQTIEILNQLYAIERGSIAARIPELSLFAGGRQYDQLQLLQQIAADSAEHRNWLIAAIDACDGDLRPASLDPRTASLHYVSVDAILPRAAAGLQRLVAAYSEASRIPLTPAAAELVERILQRYEARLRQLQSIPLPRP